MEPQKTTKTNEKNRALKANETYRKVEGQALKALNSFREKVNKKSYGRTVKDTEIIAFAITLLSDDHIKGLQESSLTSQDRVKLSHEEYCKTHGKISFDDYLWLVVRGEIKTEKQKMTLEKE